jgi:hypothetical protein
MKELLYDEEHMDALFIIQPSSPSSSSSPTKTSSSNVIQMDTTTTESTTNPVAVALMSSPSSSMIIDEPNTGGATASSATTTTTTGAIHIRAHKAVLTARAEYFKALFRTNAAATAAAIIGSSSTGEKSNHDGTPAVTSSSPSRIHFKESVEAVVNVESIFRESHIRAY